jgi:glycosyltransferase involved in cell wall biosynthesis
MRIGLVFDTFPELSETFLLHHAGALLDGGHEITIFARPAAPQPMHEAVVERGLLSRTRFLRRQVWGLRQAWDVPRTLLGSIGLPGVLRTLNVARYGTGALRFRALHALRTFSGAEFDLLHCHYASLGWAFLPYRDIFGVPIVTSFHGDHYKSFGRDGGGHLGALFRLGDAFIANGRFTAGELRHLGCAEDKIHIIPAAVSDSGVEFRPRPAGIPGSDGHLRILCVARLDHGKGIQVAIDAIAELRAQSHNATLTVVGGGSYGASLEEQRDRLGLADAVTFLGWRTQREVYEHYRSADLVVLPSIGTESGSNESQGVVLQEAMLHGVPVAASSIGGVPESLDDGRAGTLCPPGDAHALAVAMVDMAAHSDRTLTKVRAGEAYVRRRYLKPAILRAHEMAYAQALDRYARTANGRASRSRLPEQ